VLPLQQVVVEIVIGRPYRRWAHSVLLHTSKKLGLPRPVYLNEPRVKLALGRRSGPCLVFPDVTRDQVQEALDEAHRASRRSDVYAIRNFVFQEPPEE
jgi:hypothetical protein